MAKDGTMRGGARRGAGGKPKELREKFLDGKTATVLITPELPEPDDNLEGQDMPRVDDWLREQQQLQLDEKSKSGWQAEEIVLETYEYLRGFKVEKLISTQQLYAFAVAEARWIQCHRAISKYGFLAKHPTTGAPIESPYVKMADKFAKQAAAAWYSIFQVVRNNSIETFDGMTPHDRAMSELMCD